MTGLNFSYVTDITLSSPIDSYALSSDSKKLIISEEMEDQAHIYSCDITSTDGKTRVIPKKIKSVKKPSKNSRYIWTDGYFQATDKDDWHDYKISF